MMRIEFLPLICLLFFPLAADAQEAQTGELPQWMAEEFATSGFSGFANPSQSADDSPARKPVIPVLEVESIRSELVLGGQNLTESSLTSDTVSIQLPEQAPPSLGSSFNEFRISLGELTNQCVRPVDTAFRWVVNLLGVKLTLLLALIMLTRRFC